MKIFGIPDAGSIAEIEAQGWHPASGHPGGWRVVRGYSPVIELEGRTGRLVLFKSYGAAEKRANQLNTPTRQAEVTGQPSARFG